MKDKKLILKEAREAIKNKEYELSLKLCKQILKEESNNYMALIFFGVSLQETGQSSKALSAFQNAVEANPSNSLGWNGLINYYEKNDDKETKTELIKAYISLLNTDITEKKIIECVQKLCRLSEHGNLEEISLAIYSLLKSKKCEDVTEIATSLVNILLKEKKLPETLIPVYEEVLNIVSTNQKTVCVKYYAEYLNLLYRLNKNQELVHYAKKMHSIFQSDCISLKWICKIFNECYVETDGVSEKEEDINFYCETLAKLEFKSATAMFTKSILLIQNKKFIEAKEFLDQVVNVFPGSVHAWVLLLKCCFKLYLLSEAIHAANKIDKLLQSSDNSKHKLKKIVDVTMIEVFSRSDDEEDVKRALELYQTVDDELKSSCIYHIIRANINLKNFTQANVLLADLQNTCDNKQMVKLLIAQLLHKQEKYEEALEILQDEDVELSEWWLQVGKLHWDLGQKNKSLMPFLKATKLDATNYKCFLFLGHYYKNMNDLDKARRCYEKSFKLNTKSSEAGIELSKIYRKIKNWDANLTLLEALTAGVINKKNSWAWMQLGLHHLEQQDYDKAITNLRITIRIEENNMNCWESLADAYLAKGAYTSALKCYDKVSSVSENPLYSLLQMATIKQILGEFAEAKCDFEHILKTDPLYVPALKGMVETCLLKAREFFKNQRLGSCRDYVQCTVTHLVVAFQQRNDLGCLWKLLGDGCFLVTKLPPKYCFLTSFNIEGDKVVEANATLNKDELFNLAAKCYCKSLGFLEDNCLLWHDLAVCYLSHSSSTKDRAIYEQLINKSQIITQYCTSKNPTNWQHWNLLGNIVMSLDPPNYSLAQHSFIKAVLVDNNSATAWCNLGTLYFLLEDYKLANEAYSQAQRADPNYVSSWIGQALLAENLLHEDSMDLFRHSTQLGFHMQGALGYAHWVCKTLKESPLDAVIYSIHNMHAVPVACDVITWYTEHNPMDAAAWNMLGMLKERMGLKLGALEAFKTSLNLSNQSCRDLVQVNYGRLLATMGKYSQAIDTFTKIEAATFNSGSGLALALFKDKRYKESYETYESTLHWLSDEPHYQSDLLVALASMAYMFEGPEAAKTLLFQSIQLEKPSPWGFYATLSLGLLQDDFNLSELVLSELNVLKDRKECIEHFAILKSYFYLLKKNSKTAIRELSKIIHRHPDQASAWLTLSSLLIRLNKEKRFSKAAAKCAHIAMELGQSSMNVTKVLSLVALSFFVGGDQKSALSMAQKAIHCYPNMAENWAVFIVILLRTAKLPENRVKDVLNFARTLDTGENLSQWMQKTMFK